MNQTKIITSWSEIGISPGGRNKMKARCPNCHDRRKDKRDKSLSVDSGKGIAFCHYCEISYVIKKLTFQKNWKMETRMEKKFIKPLWKNDTTLSAKAVRWFESRGIGQETIRKMKITEGPEYMPQPRATVNTIQFNYFENDELVNTKFRTGAKEFKMVQGAELIPYNIGAARDSEIIYITEGEMDALSLIEAGYPALSVPNGASDSTDYLNRFMPQLMEKRVCIAVDTDSKGMVLREALVRRFGPENCVVVDSWGEGCKDANECLMMYGPAGIQEAIAGAREVPVSGVFNIGSFEKDLDSLLETGMQRGLTIGHYNFDELCSFETKRMAVVTGIPGSGKSEFLDEIAVRLNLLHKWKFGYFSPENYPLKYHASKIISKITGKDFSRDKLSPDEYRRAKEYMNDNFYFICPEDDFTIDTVLEKARYLVRRYGVRSIVIDPWNRLEHRIPAGQTETNYISQALDRISNFAQREDALVFVTAHPYKLKKQPGEAEYEAPTMYDISGSANFYNKADYGICVHRLKLKGYTEVHVQKVKFRHLGSSGLAKFKFNPFNGRYVPIDNELDAVMWENRNFLTETPQGATDQQIIQ